MILQAKTRTDTFYFRGSANNWEWTRDREQAEVYTDEEAARADLVGSPPVYDHYVIRARAIPA